MHGVRSTGNDGDVERGRSHIKKQRQMALFFKLSRTPDKGFSDPVHPHGAGKSVGRGVSYGRVGGCVMHAT